MENETYEQKNNREIEETLKRFPQIGVVMRRGVRWYYVIKNEQPIYTSHPQNLLKFKLV